MLIIVITILRKIQSLTARYAGAPKPAVVFCYEMAGRVQGQFGGPRAAAVTEGGL